METIVCVLSDDTRGTKNLFVYRASSRCVGRKASRWTKKRMPIDQNRKQTRHDITIVRAERSLRQ